MVPYASFLYFGVLLYVVATTPVMQLFRRTWRVWLLVATLAMLVVQYWTAEKPWPNISVQTIWLVLGYAVFEWAVAMAFSLVRKRGKHRLVFYSAVALGLAPLVVVKFLPLFSQVDLIGFLGISYLTFRALDVIFCVQDKLITSLSVPQYFAFLLFFPTISSGPVDRYRRFTSDWNHNRTWKEFRTDLDGALHRVFMGFLYKFILAMLIKQYWLDPWAGSSQAWGIISYMYAYSFYLFFDFAGYSNFAVGVSYLLGIHPPDNFRMPFIARSIRDFWDRWHISLSYWFRDHVYMRFVFTALKGRWFKSTHVAGYLGFVLSMGLMGVWHGTQVHFVAYGLYHAGLLIGNDWLSRWNTQHHIWGQGRPWKLAQIFLTFNLVCFGFLIFSGRLF
ncbi:MAG: D-alanyl-lipoteichoic acid biosynthesis protein DltB [Chloroflexi bacterium]|nr:D-alanyl-lipoteichoic acid biosynthesis protein DltB [Chloroflexota bacterium]